VLPLDALEPRQIAQVDELALAQAEVAALLQVGPAGADLAALRLIQCLGEGDHALNPCRSRSGRRGSSRGRKPVAWATALQIEGATGRITSSAIPTARPVT